jgi:hypothetical protein
MDSNGGQLMTDRKTKNNFPELLVWGMIAFMVASVIVGVWWIPQKWQACGRLYDNILAQSICLAFEK